MRKVLLVGINSSWSQSNPALFFLRQVIAGLPYRVELVQYTLADHITDLLSDIHARQPEILCFSAYIWNRMYLQELIPACKKLLPETVIVVGGPEAEQGEFCLGDRDFMVSGSGEGAFRALAERDFIPDSNATARHIPLPNLPFPYVPEDKALLAGKLVYYETYRGCPYACVYCLSASDERRELRFDVGNPVQLSKLYGELEALQALQPRTLKFVDRSFNTQAQLARSIWQYVVESTWDCEVHFEIYPDLLEEEDYRILERAPEGRIRFEMGIQTTNDEVARACGRHSKWEQARKALLETKQRTKVRIHADLIAGLPGEDYASVLRSVDELCATLPDVVQLGTLKVLPNTPMQEIAVQRGYIWLDNPPYQCLASDALSFYQMSQLETFGRLLNLYWNKEEFADRWQAMLKLHPATEILSALQQQHQVLGYPLHSLAKAKREAVMAGICKTYGE